jgi:hypothetical protein
MLAFWMTMLANIDDINLSRSPPPLESETGLLM